PAAGGPGALIGGRNGLILTLFEGEFHVARPADYFDPSVYTGAGLYGDLTGPVVGLAVLPGDQPGQTEAWAGLAGRTFGHWDPNVGYNPSADNNGVDQILHYSSDPADPLQNPGPRVEPLP